MNALSFCSMVFTAKPEITINTIKQKNNEARKLNFPKYKRFFSLGDRKFHFLKYKKLFKSEFFHFLSLESYFLKYKRNIRLESFVMTEFRI